MIDMTKTQGTQDPPLEIIQASRVQVTNVQETSADVSEGSEAVQLMCGGPLFGEGVITNRWGLVTASSMAIGYGLCSVSLVR